MNDCTNTARIIPATDSGPKIAVDLGNGSGATLELPAAIALGTNVLATVTQAVLSTTISKDSTFDAIWELNQALHRAVKLSQRQAAGERLRPATEELINGLDFEELRAVQTIVAQAIEHFAPF